MQASELRMPKRIALVLALAGAAACPGPTDPTPQIAVSPRAPDVACRLTRVCGGGRDAGAAVAARARAHPLVRGQELGGPNATGKAGDWVLENDEVVFVIDGLGGGGGFAESGGNVIDAADARVRKDELGQLFTYFGEFPRQGVYTSIDAREERDGSAVVVARGTELWDGSLEVVTTYQLAAGDRALLLRTTLKNTGRSAASVPGLGDAIQWGGAEKLAPGKPLGFKGRSSGAFVGGIGRFTSYAITSTDGEIAAISGGAWTDTEQRKSVVLEPGREVAYERVFVVGQRGDAASVVAELTRAAGGEVGAVEIALVDAAGRPAAVVPGAKVVLGTAADPEILSLVATGEPPRLAGEVPPGKWRASFAPSAGRRGAGNAAPLDVKAGAVARAALVVTEPSSARLGPCTEGERPVPCKLTIEGASGTHAPDLGPAHVGGPAKNQLTLLAGQAIDVPLPHGTYRITASRGPEYEIATRELVVPRDAGAAAPFVLRRVVATPGYVAGDFHQHTILSADAPVAIRDRVIGNAAEGVEVAVATEHNVVADLAPVARELGLSPFLVAIAGDELTTDASRKPWGHANAFPLPVRQDRPRGGAIVVRDRSPREVFAETRALPGGPRVLTVNHPRSGKNGYFDLLGFDTKTATASDPAYDATFDALEVWNGRNVEHRSQVLADFVALLRHGHPVTPIAATDTHGIVGQEAGYPRTYVRVSDDENLDAWDAARTSDLVRGVRDLRDVVLTNGPFMTVTAGRAGIGGIVASNGRDVEVRVRVVTASWNQVDTVEIAQHVAHDAKSAPPAIVRRVAPRRQPDGSYVAELAVSVGGASDRAVVVTAHGKGPMRPVIEGDDAEVLPWAMSGPLWIDADGDGKSLGR